MAVIAKATIVTIMTVTLFVFRVQPIKAQTFEEVGLQQVNDLITKVQQFRTTYTNYRVRFREVNQRGLLIGDLYYAKPDQLRINYYRGKTPITEVYLGRDKLLVYFITSKIVYEQENFNVVTTAERNGSMVAGSMDYLLEKYNFNFKDSREPISVFTDDGYRKFNFTKNPNQFAYHLELTPKNIVEGLDNVELWIAATPTGADKTEKYTPNQILRSKTVSINGNESDIYFTPIEINQEFPVDIFTLVIPANVRIVKNFFPALEL